MINCKYCQSEIHETAVVCSHCSHYQDWRRYINLSSVYLSLLIALFTVVSFSYPYLKSQLESPHTELSATLLGIDENNKFHLMVTNSGNRVGTVSGIRLAELNTAEAQDELEFSITGMNYDSYELIKPGEAIKIEAESNNPPVLIDGLKLTQEQEKYVSKCLVGLNAINFNGQVDHIAIEFKCVPTNLKEKWKILTIKESFKGALSAYKGLPFIGGALSSKQVQGALDEAFEKVFELRTSNTNESSPNNTSQPITEISAD